MYSAGHFCPILTIVALSKQISLASSFAQIFLTTQYESQDSLVSITTGYGLDSRGSILGRGNIFR
jgi:hypothetical protein